jgi:dienelactone hydrolase
MKEQLTILAFSHEGDQLEGRIALPEGDGPFPAVLVMANAFGLGDHMCQVARRLADIGYVGIATDMYGGGALSKDMAGAGPLYTKVMSNPSLVRARTLAWLEAARAHSKVDAGRIAAIGYCFGGMCVLELARSGADVKAVVSFHGLLSTPAPAQPGAITCEVVAYCGAKDPFAPLAQIETFRQEMETAQARHQITIFGEAAHSFTDPDAQTAGRPGIEYHALSDHLSWAGTVALLAALL